jgi:hypothetical protein
VSFREGLKVIAQEEVFFFRQRGRFSRFTKGDANHQRSLAKREAGFSLRECERPLVMEEKSKMKEGSRKRNQLLIGKNPMGTGRMI